MKSIISDTKRYLKDALNVAVQIETADLSAILPYFYKEYYQLFRLKMQQEEYLLCMANKPLYASQIRKQLADLKERSGKKIIFLSNTINAGFRRALVQNDIPFIVPFNQLHLPQIGISFKERFPKVEPMGTMLKPAAQVLLLRALLYKDYQAVTATEYAGKLDYTPMSIARAFNELQEHGLVIREKQGIEKPYIWLFKGKELWEKAQNLLQNPVRQALWLSGEEPLPYPLAGISALARYSQLTDDDYYTYATISSILQKDIPHNEIHKGARPAEKVKKVEVWIYHPQLITGENMVDKLSLYLSLKDEPDERVQIALDNMLEDIKW